MNGTADKMKRFNDFGSWITNRFGFKVQKISIDGGFSCPNRDGTKGLHGCTYCNNRTFSPIYAKRKESITEQLKAGVRFFSHKYPTMKYLAYFQSYTNTYAKLNRLQEVYEEALDFPDVVGLIIGTRPDCMPPELLDYLAELSRHTFILIEYGVESTIDSTLQRIRRGHTWDEARNTILRTAQCGILIGAHLILGLPGESVSDMLCHANRISALPISTIKLHQLQILRHTAMAKEFANHPEHFDLFSADNYAQLVIAFLERLPFSIAVDRFVSQSPSDMLIAPDWGLKNYQFTAIVNRYMAAQDTFQGKNLTAGFYQKESIGS